MKQLILSGMFVVCGLSVSLASEKWAVDSINWHRAEQKMQEKDFQDAALTYKELITKGDSLFVDYAGRHVEDMREQYSIDELDLQNGMQQKKIWKLVFITILCLVVLLFVGLLFEESGEKTSIFQRRVAKGKRLAEESVRNKSVFLSNMSHEIKTPLNALAGFSEILITPGIDDEVRAQCNDVIRLNSDLLLHLVNDVVDVSCLDVANMRFSVAPHEVVALCRNVVEMLRNIKQTSAEMILRQNCLLWKWKLIRAGSSKY